MISKKDKNRKKDAFLILTIITLAVSNFYLYSNSSIPNEAVKNSNRNYIHRNSDFNGNSLISTPSGTEIKSKSSVATHEQDHDKTPGKYVNQHRTCKGKILSPFFLKASLISEHTKTSPRDYKIERGKKVFVNKGMKSYSQKNKYSTCKFIEYQDASASPVPILFLVMGRSGSTNTWDTLSQLAGGKMSQAVEAMGSGEGQVKEFFDYIKTEEVGRWWINEHLCELAKVNCNSAIVGFQWKPYLSSWNSPGAQGVLQGIARNNNGTHNEVTKIKVLYMTRNPLDVIISKFKHKLSDNVAAHCHPDDSKCLKKHDKIEKKMHLKTSNLLSKLELFRKQDQAITLQLEELGIDYYQTFYNKLYEADDAGEWMNIFQYLGVGPMKGLALDTVERAFPLAKTTKLSRQEVLGNYQEVYDLLKDTEFLHFLTD